MAVIAPIVISQQSIYGHVWTVQWTPVTNADTCAAVCMAHAADRSIQCIGTFGAATMTLQGTNDPTNDFSLAANFLTLHDPQGVPLTMTTAKIIEVAELCFWMKPTFAGGDGTQSLTVQCTFRSMI